MSWSVLPNTIISIYCPLYYIYWDSNLVRRNIQGSTFLHQTQLEAGRHFKESKETIMKRLNLSFDFSLV